MMSLEPGATVRVVRSDPFFTDRIGEIVAEVEDQQFVVQFNGFQQRFRPEQLRSVPETEGYLITRAMDGPVVCFVRRGAEVSHVPHVVLHSPTGFEIGYGGSGSSDLALSILAEFLEVEPRDASAFNGHDLSPDAQIVWAAHPAFRDTFIAKHTVAPGGEYVIPVRVVRWFMERRGAIVCETES